jgi:hypothetical protein
MNAIAIPNIAEIEKLKSMVISIVSPESEVAARGHLTQVRLASKKLKADIDLMKKPHKDAIKAIDDAAKPWANLLAERDEAIERALLAHKNKMESSVATSNRKSFEKYEDKVARVEAKAIEQGKPIPMVIPPEMKVAPQKSVQVDGATQTVVKRKAWRIRIAGSIVADPSIITAQISKDSDIGLPLEYFILDTARIGKVIRAGGCIPGIEMYVEESIAVRG